MSTIRPSCLFSVSSLGLGHATRTLAIIKSYESSHKLHIVSTGGALAYLQKELANTTAKFYDLADYPLLERGRGSIFFYSNLVCDSLKTPFIIKREHKYIEDLCKKIEPEFIISDGRYGSYVKGIPSCIVSHQISFIMPRGFGLFQKIADSYNFKTFSRFDKVFIPDFESSTDNLAGDLSHHTMLSALSHEYVGVLSSLRNEQRNKDIDYLFAISGYLQEHKASFISNLLESAKRLPGKKVFILGNTEEDFHRMIPENDIEIYSSASGDLRNELYNRAKFVISRSGYTTIMDLVELSINGYLIPTPGQTEQEYLAKHLASSRRFLTSEKADLDLLQSTEKISSFSSPWKTAQSIHKIHTAISSLLKK